MEHLHRYSSDLPSSPMPSPACFSCGRHSLPLHRLNHGGALRRHCTSCVLSHHKGMYCAHCFQVYRDQLGDPALWLTCCECQRLSHLECALSRDHRADSSCFTCQYCCNRSGQKEATTSTLQEGLPPSASVERREPPRSDSPKLSHEMLSTNGDFVKGSAFISDAAVTVCSSEVAGESSAVLDQEALAAANIVAALAANEAKEAKAKARSLAAAAVKAIARAKSALDAAYRAGREEARFRVEASKNLPGLAFPAAEQAMGAMQSMGLSMSDKRKLEMVAGSDNYSPQMMRGPPSEEELARNRINVPRSPRTAVPSQKRRALSAIAAAEATRTHANSGVALQQEAALVEQQQQRLQNGDSTGTKHYGSLTSAPKVTIQVHGDLIHAVPFTSSEGLVVSASPASILEGGVLLGSPRSSSLTLPTNSMVDTDIVGHGLSSTFLPGRELHETDEIPVSGNDLLFHQDGVLAADCSEGPLRTGEAGTDDCMDLGAFLPQETERETKISSRFVAGEGDLAPSTIALDSAVYSEKTRHCASGSVAAGNTEENACFGAVNHSSVMPSCSERQTVTQVAGEQGKPFFDESCFLDTKAFMQKNQRAIVLHMPLSNHGEKSLQYSMTKKSVSTTCSVPLQSTALTGVPTGQHS